MYDQEKRRKPRFGVRVKGGGEVEVSVGEVSRVTRGRTNVRKFYLCTNTHVKVFTCNTRTTTRVRQRNLRPKREGPSSGWGENTLFSIPITLFNTYTNGLFMYFPLSFKTCVKIQQVYTIFGKHLGTPSPSTPT